MQAKDFSKEQDKCISSNMVRWCNCALMPHLLPFKHISCLKLLLQTTTFFLLPTFFPPPSLPILNIGKRKVLGQIKAWPGFGVEVLFFACLFLSFEQNFPAFLCIYEEQKFVLSKEHNTIIWLCVWWVFLFCFLNFKKSILFKLQ